MELVIWQKQNPQLFELQIHSYRGWKELRLLWRGSDWSLSVCVHMCVTIWLRDCVLCMCSLAGVWIWACMWVFSVCVCCIYSEDVKASWQLLIFHQKQDWGFHPAQPSFLCLCQIGWKWNGLFYVSCSKWLDNRAWRSTETTLRGCDLLSSTWNRRAIWSPSEPAPQSEWNLTDRREVSSGVG